MRYHEKSLENCSIMRDTHRCDQSHHACKCTFQSFLSSPNLGSRSCHASPFRLNCIFIRLASVLICDTDPDAPCSSCKRSSARTEDFHAGTSCLMVVKMVPKKNTLAENHSRSGAAIHRYCTWMKFAGIQDLPTTTSLSLPTWTCSRRLALCQPWRRM